MAKTAQSLSKYIRAATGQDLTSGMIAAIQSFGSKINPHPYLHFLVTEGGTDKEGEDPSHPPVIAEETPFVPARGWAELIRKIYEIDPLLSPKCSGQMRIISFIEEHKVIDKIINHLKLTFKAECFPSTSPASAGYGS